MKRERGKNKEDKKLQAFKKEQWERKHEKERQIVERKNHELREI